MQRGDLWWASLPLPAGSEPGYRRPVLVVQADSFNRSRIQTVVVVAITSNVALGQAPGNVLLSKRATGLPKASVANVSQMLTLDRSMLARKIGSLPSEEMRKVDAGLRLVLQL